MTSCSHSRFRKTSTNNIPDPFLAPILPNRFRRYGGFFFGGGGVISGCYALPWPFVVLGLKKAGPNARTESGFPMGLHCDHENWPDIGVFQLVLCRMFGSVRLLKIYIYIYIYIYIKTFKIATGDFF